MCREAVTCSLMNGTMGSEMVGVISATSGVSHLELARWRVCYSLLRFSETCQDKGQK